MDAAEQRIDRVSAYVYDRMYENIRIELIIGAICGIGAAVCRLLLPQYAPLWVVLASLCLVIGYFPWFISSVVYFEKDVSGSVDAEDANGRDIENQRNSRQAGPAQLL